MRGADVFDFCKPAIAGLIAGLRSFISSRDGWGACGLSRRLAVLFLLVFFISRAGEGGEDAPGKSASGQNGAYSQAVRNAERELLEREALPDSGNGWSVSAFLSIVALALALGVTAWLARRLRGGGWTRGLGKEMAITDRLPLGRHSTLFIVRISGRRYWLAEHSHGITLLGECLDEKSVSLPPGQAGLHGKSEV